MVNARQAPDMAKRVRCIKCSSKLFDVVELDDKTEVRCHECKVVLLGFKQKDTAVATAVDQTLKGLNGTSP